ncbi:MAG: LysM peptidoglycan-binding domain-containing protein [Pseudomonadales bacterium]|nr:LysM peptidoglycan-binding domain-containing protein [Pseudomonadales bacterium]
MKKFLLPCVLSMVLMVGHFYSSALLAAPAIKADHPTQYIVKDGDTLWDIASIFLADAWLWPEIWDVNPEIKNPHLIFPGDVIFLQYVDGQPQLKVTRGQQSRTVKLTPVQPKAAGDRNIRLSPTVRRSPLNSSIPAIPLDAISSLLTTGRIVEQYTLRDAPHVLAGTADRLIFGPGDGIYARGNWPADKPAVFGVFRRGEIYLDPETREVLGFEAREVGTATVEKREDDIYTLMLSTVKEDVRIGDSLLPTEQRRVESVFFPSSPKQKTEGVIMTVLGGVTQVGRNDVVAINRGNVNGVKVGNVFAIHKKGQVVRDRVAGERVQLPSERAGLLMVFRSFEKMAYGLVLETEEPLRIGDIVQNP